MLGVVCWLWGGFRDYRAEQVNTLQRMFARQLELPHRFWCVADDPAGLNLEAVRYWKTPPAAAAIGAIKSPEGDRFPSCYRRLWMFSQEAEALGDRLLLIDIDLLLTAPIAPLLDRPEDFVGWQPIMQWGRIGRFGGGLYLLRAGSRRHVWDRFKGAESITAARAAGFRGSDQAWISYCLSNKGEATWSRNAGIYSIRDIRNGALPLPIDARLVQFNGPQKPWNTPLPWAREFWQQSGGVCAEGDAVYSRRRA